MIATANIWADLFLSLAALLGLGVLRKTLAYEMDALSARFLFCVRVMMLLFGGRALLVVTGGAGFRFVVLIAASLLPLAVLLLTEGLLRRHSPAWAKGTVAAGTVFFVLLSFWYTDTVDPLRLIGLLIFQVAGLCIAGWLVVTRDKAGLTVAENLMVSRLGLSLFILIPLAATDFLMVYIGIPVQLSALGVLTLVWLSVGLGRNHAGHSGPIYAVLTVILASIIAGGTIGVIGGMGKDGIILAIALVLATLLLVSIVTDAKQILGDVQSLSLLRHLARGKISDPITFLRELQNHPLVEGAAIIESQNLVDYDADILTQIFDSAPVLRRANPPALSEAANEHIAHLFERYAATHIMLAANNPRVLVALSMPGLSSSPNAELELLAVQRMASLIARAGAVK